MEKWVISVTHSYRFIIHVYKHTVNSVGRLVLVPSDAIVAIYIQGFPHLSCSCHLTAPLPSLSPSVSFWYLYLEGGGLLNVTALLRPEFPIQAIRYGYALQRLVFSCVF